MAIKTPRFDSGRQAALKDFCREAKMAISLDHPNIVPCLGFSIGNIVRTPPPFPIYDVAALVVCSQILQEIPGSFSNT